MQHHLRGVGKERGICPFTQRSYDARKVKQFYEGIVFSRHVVSSLEMCPEITVEAFLSRLGIGFVRLVGIEHSIVTAVEIKPEPTGGLLVSVFVEISRLTDTCRDDIVGIEV